MYCYVMQPWITIRGQSSTIPSITQSENCWLDLTAFQDIVAWLDCKEVAAGTGGTNVQMAYQTSPTKDDSLFVPVTAAFNVATGVTTTVMLKDVVTNPLCRWLRWQLTVTGTPTTPWDTTFRVFIAANVVGKGRPSAAASLKTRQAPPVASPSAPLHQQPGLLGYASPATGRGVAPAAFNPVYSAAQAAGQPQYLGTFVPQRK
jgi:hypothetical protein